MYREKNAPGFTLCRREEGDIGLHMVYFSMVYIIFVLYIRYGSMINKKIKHILQKSNSNHNRIQEKILPEKKPSNM